MAKTYKTPGVYIEEIPKFPPSIAPVETAVPAFIGYTEKAKDLMDRDLKLKPTRITSMVEYERYFGMPQKEERVTVTIDVKTEDSKQVSQKAIAALDRTHRSKHVMNYAIQMFFANGGGPCYIVSVEKYKTLGADLDVTELENGLVALQKEDEPTLIVFPEAQNLKIGDFETIQNSALNQCAKLQDRFVIMDVHGGDVSLSDSKADLRQAVINFRSSGIGTNNLKYGAAYGPNIETILDFAVDEAKTKVWVATDKTPPVEFILSSLESDNNINYEAARAAIRDLSNILPPSAAIAGIYSAVDGSRGVWKAPANVSINGVIAPTIQFTNAEQDQMNIDASGKSINAIRAFTGKGTLVWGARTLAGNDNEWRYVNVRRLFIFVEESVKKATEPFVFEPNDRNTWVRVQGMIENFLTTLWRQGALQGVKPEHAFYVSVGLGKTMTALDILEGRMIVEIGMAAVRPAEFIILNFSHKMAES